MKEFKFPRADMSATHVTMVFLDGEVSMTKGGELFGSRSLHCMKVAVLPEEAVKDLPEWVTDQFNGQYSGYKCAFIQDTEDADEYRAWLIEHGISDAKLDKMKEYLTAQGWGIVSHRTKEPLDNGMLAEVYAQCKGFQDDIADRIHSYIRDARDNGEEAIVARAEDYLANTTVLEYDILSELRSLRKEK